MPRSDIQLRMPIHLASFPCQASNNDSITVAASSHFPLYFSWRGDWRQVVDRSTRFLDEHLAKVSRFACENKTRVDKNLRSISETIDGAGSLESLTRLENYVFLGYKGVSRDRGYIHKYARIYIASRVSVGGGWVDQFSRQIV